jgi:predicted DNA-binding protein (MmcQ/YjbR family)
MKAPAGAGPHPQSAAMHGWLEAKPGVTTGQAPGPGGRPPTSTMYKVGGKLFAILAIRGAPWVIVKSDPHLVDILKSQYAGVGHRSHLDRRFWICIALDADVPQEEARRLVDASYDLVRATLTKKQQAALGTS